MRYASLHNLASCIENLKLPFIFWQNIEKDFCIFFTKTDLQNNWTDVSCSRNMAEKQDVDEYEWKEDDDDDDEEDDDEESMSISKPPLPQVKQPVRTSHLDDLILSSDFSSDDDDDDNGIDIAAACKSSDPEDSSDKGLQLDFILSMLSRTSQKTAVIKVCTLILFYQC